MRKGGSAQTSEMLSDRCKSHDFHRLKMCTESAPNINFTGKTDSYQKQISSVTPGLRRTLYGVPLIKYSTTHPGSLIDTLGRMPGVELREPRNLCVCVNKECGHGEGVGVHGTLMTDTRRRVVSLTENAGRMPGGELRERVCE